MEDRRPAIVGVIIAFQVLSWLALGLRLYVRRFMVKLVGWDDILILIAMVPVLAQAILQLFTTKYGLGLHIADVPVKDLTTMLAFVWWSGIAFNLSHLIIKLSYFAFYLRLMPDRRKRTAVYAGAGFVIAVGITFTTLSIFMCTPIQRGWDKSVPGTCVDGPGFLLSNSALNMVADAVVFIMPIPALWTLHLPLRQRLVLAGTFTCGALILVASAVRLDTIFKLVVPDSPDPTWELGPLILWAEIEVNLAVILSCSPAFKALLQSLFPSFMNSLVTGTAATTRKTGAEATRGDTYVLQSRGRDDAGGFRTVIEASPQNAGDLKHGDLKSVDSREPILDSTSTPAPGFRVETSVTVRSSSKESVDEELRSIA